MPFVSYATKADVDVYVPGASADLWASDESAITGALQRAARKINERLEGMDRFSVIPVLAEDDGNYAEVLVELNVYLAVWARVKGLYAGEAFEDQWAWLRVSIREIWADIESGKYSFGSEPKSATAGAYVLETRRSSL